jgi:hypothetical protein
VPLSGLCGNRNKEQSLGNYWSTEQTQSKNNSVLTGDGTILRHEIKGVEEKSHSHIREEASVIFYREVLM